MLKNEYNIAIWVFKYNIVIFVQIVNLYKQDLNFKFIIKYNIFYLILYCTQFIASMEVYAIIIISNKW